MNFEKNLLDAPPNQSKKEKLNFFVFELRQYSVPDLETWTVKYFCIWVLNLLSLTAKHFVESIF